MYLQNFIKCLENPELLMGKCVESFAFFALSLSFNSLKSRLRKCDPVGNTSDCILPISATHGKYDKNQGVLLGGQS